VQDTNVVTTGNYYIVSCCLITPFTTSIEFYL